MDEQPVGNVLVFTYTNAAAFCTIWRRLMEDPLNHTYRALRFPAKLAQRRGCCFRRNCLGRILLYRNEMLMPLSSVSAFNAMPAKGLVHC